MTSAYIFVFWCARQRQVLDHTSWNPSFCFKDKQGSKWWPVNPQCLVKIVICLDKISWTWPVILTSHVHGFQNNNNWRPEKYVSIFIFSDIFNSNNFLNMWSNIKFLYSNRANFTMFKPQITQVLPRMPNLKYMKYVIPVQKTWCIFFASFWHM